MNLRDMFSVFLALTLSNTVVLASYPITGVPGETYPRLEISTLFQENPIQWNIYLLALEKFKAEPQSNQLSYYGVASIHGYPNVPWDGVEQTAHGIGYCAHSSNLFPTWHRPYVALFEQKLVEIARDIADTFPAGQLREQYQNAASTLRAPYWDWAAKPQYGQNILPDIIIQPNATVQTPSGNRSIVNPLYLYAFRPFNKTFSGSKPFDFWPETLRSPSTSNPAAKSREGRSQSNLGLSEDVLRRGLYMWFTNCPHYRQVSEDQFKPHSQRCYFDLEALHDDVHAQVGGFIHVNGTKGDLYTGHMGDLGVAAFDPIFMLHHANVDRLFALWQAVYPHSYTGNETAETATFTIQIGSVQGLDSRNFWTSRLVRKTEAFHYTYPEFVDTDGSSAAIRSVINQLYGPSTTSQTPSPATAEVSLTANNGSSYEYISNIITTRFGLNGTYTVSVFVGTPQTEDPSLWTSDPAFAGSMGVFASPGMTESNVVSTNVVFLTGFLATKVANGVIPNLEEASVVPYLTQNLAWRVCGPSGIVNPSTVPNFSLSVVASTLQPPASPSDFSLWSEFITLPQVTQGKPGGLSS